MIHHLRLCYMINHLPSCHIINHLPSKPGHFMSYNTSPAIDAWSFHMIHHLPSMRGHVMWYITYHQYLVMSCDTSPIINTWSCHIWLIFHGRMIIWCDTSPTIDTWLCIVMHHLPSICCHVMWYILYHQYLFMSYDQSTYCPWKMILLCDTSPTIDTWLCHIMHHLPSICFHVMWYIFYHQYLVMSYDPLTYFPWKNDLLMWYITYNWCLVMSINTSPTIDAWSCITYHWWDIYTSPTFDAWSCHMIHHLPSMHGYIIWYITYYRCMIMSYNASPIIDEY